MRAITAAVPQALPCRGCRASAALCRAQPCEGLRGEGSGTQSWPPAAAASLQGRGMPRYV